MTFSRRGFLRAAGVGTAGLVIAFHVPQAAGRTERRTPPLPPANAFLRIGKDESVTVMIAHSEMGQGIWTGLAMLIAEELDCDWARVRCEHAPADPVYGNAIGMQMTGGSSSTYGEFDRYRNVGAVAKDMLVRAAAARWRVAPAACKAENGVVTGAGKRLTYGELAVEAMKLQPPASVKLKEPKDWKIIGKVVRRLDSPEKVTGRAKFGMDVQLPGLRTALIARPPAFGSKVVKFDGAAALKVPGVEKVVQIANGVAVVAQHFWAAKLGRDALVVEWSPPPDGGVDTTKYMAELRTLAGKPGAQVAQHGTPFGKDASKVASTLTSVYEVPFLAHAPMEPLNCTVKINGDGTCDIYTGTQAQSADQQVASGILGIDASKVRVHTQFLGGGFGRRGNPTQDFVNEAVQVAKAAGVPVKTVWTREDDIRGGYYRPAYVHQIVAKVDKAGMPVGWDHVVAGQSIMTGTPWEMFVVKDGVDPTSVEGLAESPYLRASARTVSLHSPKLPVSVLWWRSVGNTHTAFAMECMIDELAHHAKADPLAFRLRLLDGAPRHAAALRLAAEKAGWGKPPPAGRARGLAVHESFRSVVAQCAEVSVEGGRIRVHKVACAVDCGIAVNPLGIEAQVQSSIVYGLSAALHGKLDLVGGAVQQGNFHDYPVLRMFEMPEVSVHIIPSDAAMGGIGEPATAPIAPAVANAVFALTQQRLRTLPLRVAAAKEARG